MFIPCAVPECPRFALRLTCKYICMHLQVSVCAYAHRDCECMNPCKAGESGSVSKVLFLSKSYMQSCFV
jgi:hypothetical protein